MDHDKQYVSLDTFLLESMIAFDCTQLFAAHHIVQTIHHIRNSNNGRILPRYSDIPLIFDWPDCGWTLYLLEKMR